MLKAISLNALRSVVCFSLRNETFMNVFRLQNVLWEEESLQF